MSRDTNWSDVEEEVFLWITVEDNLQKEELVGYLAPAPIKW